MEALQLKMDDLRWEVDRLEEQNRELQSQNPELSDKLTLMAQLEEAQRDVLLWTQKLNKIELALREAETRAAEAYAVAAESEQKAVEAETRSSTLELEIEGLTEVCHQLELEASEANQTVELERATSQDLASKLAECEASVRGTSEMLASTERCLRELRCKHADEIVSVKKDADLARYKAVEIEQAKWEAREAAYGTDKICHVWA